MKSTTSTRKKSRLTLASLALMSMGYAATFTATTSGKFSNTSTWAGGVVPATIDLLDNIVIQSGVTVNMDNSVVLNGAAAQLDVEGTLNTTNNSSLKLNMGTLTGAGTLALQAVDLNLGSAITFTGSLTMDTLNAAIGFTSTAHIVVNKSLNLITGVLSLATGGGLSVSNNGTIVISGGSLSAAAGSSLILSGSYNVVYTGSSSLAGVELSGSGLNNLTINVNALSAVTLASDLTVAGTLSLTNGTLVLAGHNLTVNGMVSASGTGTITPTAVSNISINAAAGTVGTIVFSGLAATLNNLTINVGAGKQAFIGGKIMVAGTLQLNSGTLNFNNTSLVIGGLVSGSGSLSGNDSSNLSISGLVGASAALNFVSGGQLINNLTIAVGATNAPTLVSDLSVNGKLTLTGISNINLNGHSLTLAAGSSLVGLGSIAANATSDLVINATKGITSLKVIGTLRNLTINTAGTDSVTLANDITAAGSLFLQNGSLVLKGHNLMINGDISAGGNGTISSDSTSSIVITTSASVSGALNFSSTANRLKNLMVNIGNNGTALIGTNLQVTDSIHFIAGTLNIGRNALIMGAKGSISGAGSASYIITATAGYVQMNVTAGGSGSVNFPVGTSALYAPASVFLNTGSASGQIQVGVTNDVLLDGTTGTSLAAVQPLVDATWNVHSNVISNLNLNLQVIWSAAMQVNAFDPNACYLSHYTGGAWNKSVSTAATLSAGMYSQQMTGLTSLSPFTVFGQKAVTAVIEITNDVTFTMFPNPATDNIVIRNTTAVKGAMNMDIYSSTGKLIANYILTDATSTIPVNALINGTYFVRFYNNNTSSTKSFIKM